MKERLAIERDIVVELVQQEKEAASIGVEEKRPWPKR